MNYRILFLSLVLSIPNLCAGKDDLPYTYATHRKTVLHEGELYGIENRDGFAAFHWPQEDAKYPLLLGPYDESYNLRVLQKDGSLFVAYGPQAYELSRKKFHPLLLKKNTGKVDAFHWLGLIQGRAHALKKINRGEFVLYDLTQKPVALKLRRPANGPALGKDIFHFTEDEILHGGTKSTTLIQISLAAGDPPMAALSLPSPHNQEDVLGTFMHHPLRWYGATTGRNPHFYAFNVEENRILWGLKMTTPLACPPLVTENKIFLVTHQDYEPHFSLITLNENGSLPQKIKGDIPSPHVRSIHLDQVIPQGSENFFLLWRYTQTDLNTQRDEGKNAYSLLDTSLHTLSPLKDLPHGDSRYVMTQEDGTVLLTY